LKKNKNFELKRKMNLTEKLNAPGKSFSSISSNSSLLFRCPAMKKEKKGLY
jgi:hypothetical protein